MSKEYLRDSFKNKKYGKDEKVHYIIITFDLTEASSSAYKEINDSLEGINFKKHIRSKIKDSSEKFPYDLIYTPKNTYIAIAHQQSYKNLNKARDVAEKKLRDFLDEQLEWGDIEGYSYLVFVAQQWSWAAGQRDT